MNWRVLVTTLLGLAVFTENQPAFGETRVSGAVSGVWEARGSPFTVTGHISLGRNDTLRIEPGVNVVFQGNYRFDINGRLLAEGTERDSIHFYGGGQPGSWIGLNFSGAGADRGHMNYCTVRFAYQGININDADPLVENSAIGFCTDAGVNYNRSLTKLLYCRIYRSNGSGIKIGGSSRASVRYCSISNCLDNGIVVNESSNPTLDHNVITDVGDHGIHLASAAPCTVMYNKILRPGARGISISESNGAIVMRNVSDGSAGPGGYIYRSAGVEFFNNTILNSGAHGVQVSTNVTGFVENCIIAYSGLNGLILQGGNPGCDYNDLYLNRDGDYNGVEAGGHDVHIPPSLDENYNPRPGNSLIDAGDPFLPGDPDGTRAEIGAGFLNQNHPPEIRSFSPNWPMDTTVRGDTAYDFQVEAVDPDGQFLSYKWFVNEVEEWRNVSYRRNFNRDGVYTVRLLVDDRYYLGQTEQVWRFLVEGSSVAFEETLPESYVLSNVYPNPFNGSSSFQMTLPGNEEILLDLRDINGRFIRNIAAGNFPGGDHLFTINAENLPAGEYIIRADIGSLKTLRRITLLK